MSKLVLRNSRGIVIGFVEVDSNGNKRLRNAKGIYQGRYDAKDNITRDARGKYLGRGDFLTTLLEN